MSVTTPSPRSEPTPPDRRRVGVVIVTYNSAEIIEGCLDALLDAAPRSRVDIVVVDNDSADDVADRARSHPIAPTVIETGTNGGYAAGINVGTRALQAGGPPDAFLILNPDCRLAPDSLDLLFDELERNGAGVVAPRINDADGALFHSIFREPTVLRGFASAVLGDRVAGRVRALGEQETRPEAYATAAEVDAASGAVLLIDAACAASVGEWDEDYFLYCEETDFQFRARRNGHRVRFAPNAVAVHDGGDSEVSPRLWALLTVNRVRLFGKFHGRFTTGLYRVAVLLNETLRAARGRGPSRAAVAALLSSRRRRDLYPPVTPDPVTPDPVTPDPRQTN